MSNDINIERYRAPIKPYNLYDGILYPCNYTLETLEYLKTFKVYPDDVWIVSYPKTGTTWTQELVSAIFNQGDIEKIKGISVENRVPHIERTEHGKTPKLEAGKFYTGVPGYVKVEKLDRPRLIKTHLPYNHLPAEVHTVKPRVIYVCRNPKDTAVSFHNFHKVIPSYRTYDNWELFLEDFLKGDTAFGKYYDHILPFWYEKNEENVLFLKYEDMKANLKREVLNIARFCKVPIDDNQADRIVSHCSFESMKKNPSTNLTQKFIEAGLGNMTVASDSPFVRKGQVGSWRNKFTVNQSEVFDRDYMENLNGTGLQFQFEPQENV